MMMRRTFAVLAFGAVAAASALPVWAEGKPTKVGFIYVGSINDGGWSQHHHESAMKMKEHFGDSVEVRTPGGTRSYEIRTVSFV